MNKQTLIIMVGPPGSGKSYFVKNGLMKHNKSIGWISRDMIRFSILESKGGNYFDHEKEVFKNFIDCLIYDIKEGIEIVVADATHIDEASRKKLITALKKYLKDISIKCVVMKTDIKTCKENNKMRSGLAVVPDDVIDSMTQRMTDPAADSFITYDAIYYIYDSNEYILNI